jgi:hypothetical protein
LAQVIDITAKNADYRRPMSRKNLLDTTAKTCLLRARWRNRGSSIAIPFRLGRRAFASLQHNNHNNAS